MAQNYFCFKLITGGRIIGWLCILNSCTVLATCVMVLRYLNEYINNNGVPGVEYNFTKGCN